MVYKVFLTSRADKELRIAPKEIRSRIADTIDFLSTNPFQDVKKLKAPFPGYRKRIGDYRILYTVEKSKITIYSIAHRKDAYR